MHININKKKDVFLVSKPLQYVNATNIRSNKKKTLLLIDSFQDAERIYNKIKSGVHYWENVHFFKEKIDAFKWLIKNKYKYDSFFVDGDYGYNYIFYKLRRLTIFVYEEGFGTYRASLNNKKDKVNAKIYEKAFLRNLYHQIYVMIMNMLGYKERLGGSRYTRGLILYYPEFYLYYIKDNKKEIHGFKDDFLTHIENNLCRDLFYYDFVKEYYKEKKVLLYLTDWNVIDEIGLIDGFDLKIIKPHPHIRECFFANYDVCLPGYVLSEYVIMDLLKKVESLVVIASCSTALIYFYDDPKIKIINILSKDDFYKIRRIIDNKNIDNDELFEKCVDAYKELVKYINQL